MLYSVKNYATAGGSKGPNYIENVKILKSKLELLAIEIENPVNYQQGNNKQIFNVNNSKRIQFLYGISSGVKKTIYSVNIFCSPTCKL